MKFPNYSEYGDLWHLDKSMAFLNHGSFGACPIYILEKQNQYRMQMERQPLKYFIRDADELLYNAKKKLSKFIGADTENMVFADNATAAVNVVMKSFPFKEGDRILITNQIYPACRNTVYKIAEDKKLFIDEVIIPLKINSEDEVTNKIVNQAKPNTVFALIDHISSLPGLIFPVKQIINKLEEKDIVVMIDGAHAPGMIPLELNELNPSFYTGNCHKWMCTPKGSAFLYVRKDMQDIIKPLVTSRRYGEIHTNLSEFQYDFSWQGTRDISSFLTISDSIEYFESVFPGGWNNIMKANHDLVFEAGKKICEEFEIEQCYPESMIGSIFGIPFFEEKESPVGRLNQRSKLQDKLFHENRIEVMISFYPKAPNRVLRISSQIYNSLEQYLYLIDTIKKSH